MRNLQGGCKISFVFSGFRISVTSIVFEGLKKLSTDLKCHLIKYSTLNPSSFPIPQGQARGILLVCHWIPVPHWPFLKNVCSSVMVLLGQLMSMFSSIQNVFLLVSNHLCLKESMNAKKVLYLRFQGIKLVILKRYIFLFLLKK